jgi:putative nucleotidyltransferase with HDIG domain
VKGILCQLEQAENTNSCLNTRAIIEYTRRRFPDGLGELFIGLPEPWSTMTAPEAYLSDENNWVPSTVVVKMFENVKRITANPSVAFDIGYESIIKREFAYFQKLFLTFFSSPRGILRILNRLNTKLNTTKTIQLLKNNTPGRAVLRWHWKSGIAISKDLCEYNKGIYSAIPTLWGLPPAKLEETTCHFDTGGYCENRLTWSLSKGRFRNVLSRIFTRKSAILRALEEVESDKALLKQRFNEVARLNLDMSHKVTVLKAINSATRMLVSTTDTQEVLEQTMKPIVGVLGFDRALIMLVDEKREYLEYRYGVGESPDAMKKIRDYKIPLDREQNLMIRVLHKKRPVLIRDVRASGLNPANRILADFQPNSFVICPLIAEEKTIGILGADRRQDKARLTTNDAEFLSIFANNIATALQRARMDEELKTSYVSSVRALVQAIEEKDTYTRGHSERVSTMAVEMARMLGMPESEIEYLRFGSILHDVGKIGIPESIVRSPKALTDAEFKIIQKHPLKGVEILQPISFIRNHLYLIRSHHERWDGRGYPDKLAADAIPLGAQIVAVADAFDAMTSSRPYRKGMPPKQAAKEIQKNMGTQFSHPVAEAFLKVFEEKLSREETPDHEKVK